MNNINTEKLQMETQFSTFPDIDWYKGTTLPSSWSLLGDVKNKKILDIGCASGWVTWHLLEQGADALATDIFETYINPLIPFAVADKENLQFEDKSYDMVATANVLHHGDLDKTTKEIYRVLKDGGVFVSLQEPCIENDTSEEEYLKEHLQNELSLGIDEHRPSLEKYKKAFSEFKSVEFYIMRDAMFSDKITDIEPLIINSYHGGIAIKAIK